MIEQLQNNLKEEYRAVFDFEVALYQTVRPSPPFCLLPATNRNLLNSDTYIQAVTAAFIPYHSARGQLTPTQPL